MQKYHPKSFLKVILLKKGRKRQFSLSICIINTIKNVKKKLGFLIYNNFNKYVYNYLSNGGCTLFFVDYFSFKKWIIRSLKFSPKTFMLFRILNLI